MMIRLKSKAAGLLVILLSNDIGIFVGRLEGILVGRSEGCCFYLHMLQFAYKNVLC